MLMTPENLVRHELCGLSVKVINSTDPTQKGLTGKVIDESYSTIRIETRDGKEKIIPKKNSVFLFTLPDRIKVSVEGKLLIGRPEDRIKKKFPRW